MKILFTSWKDLKHPKAGETEEIIWNYARSLAEKGHEVHILCSAYEGALHEEEVENVYIRRVANIHCLYFKIGRHYSQYYKHKFDIIVNECGGAPILLPRYERDTPMVLFIRYSDDGRWDQEFKYPLSEIGRFLQNRVTSFYNNFHVITLSESAKQGLINEKGFKEDKIHLIENNVVSLVTDMKKDELIYMSAQDCLDDLKVGFQAFRILHVTYSSYILEIIIHSEEQKNQFQTYLESLGISNNVRYKHTDECKIGNYKGVFLSSTNLDHGELILEASFYGTPCFGYHAPKLANQLKDGINGFQTEQGNPELLGKKAIEVFSQADGYRELVESSKGYFEQQKNYYKKTDDFEEILFINSKKSRL